MARVDVGIGIVPTLSWDETLGIAVEAERLGFASVATWDHPNLPGLEVQTTLSALAAATSRIKLWPNVLSVPYRAPSLLARAMATLDVISNGRLILGLGTGWMRDEFEAYGYEFAPKVERDAALAEAITLMRAMWSGNPTTFKGTSWSVHDALCQPPPVQKPGPPIWIGSHGGPRMLAKVIAPLADGCNLGMPHTPDAPPLETIIGRVQQACDDAGRDRDTFTISTNLVVEGYQEGVDLAALYDGAQIREGKFLPLAQPEVIAERLDSLGEIGVGQVMLGLRSEQPLEDLPKLADALPDHLAVAKS